MRTIRIPELALVILIGPAGAGKSTFAARHFAPTEILSSDTCRALVADSEADQTATRDAFDVLHYIAARRLRRGRLTVIDATNVEPEARRPLLQLARRFFVQPIAIVFDLPEEEVFRQLRGRPERPIPSSVVRHHRKQLARSLPKLKSEGFHRVYILRSAEEANAVRIEREPLPVLRRDDHGPFDIIGDVHGCFDELRTLLERLGYTEIPGPGGAMDLLGYSLQPPPGRKAIFLGDLVDRGPNTPAVLSLVMNMVAAGTALCVLGNHDARLLRKLKGRRVRVAYGLAETLEQLERCPEAFHHEVVNFLEGLPSHYLLDDGRLVVAHAGLKAGMHGRDTDAVWHFALFGDRTGEVDEFGLPIRRNWAASYRGETFVVYGHTPVKDPLWQHNTVNIDTGCVFGGRLSALRYPEREIVSVLAAREYYRSPRPLDHPIGHEPSGRRAAAEEAAGDS